MCPPDLTLASYYPSGNIETPALIPNTLQCVPSSMRHLRHVGVLAAYAVKVTVQTATRAQERDFATVPRRAPIKLEPRRASGYPAARAIARTLQLSHRQAGRPGRADDRTAVSISVRPFISARQFAHGGGPRRAAQKEGERPTLPRRVLPSAFPARIWHLVCGISRLAPSAAGTRGEASACDARTHPAHLRPHEVKGTQEGGAARGRVGSSSS